MLAIREAADSGSIWSTLLYVGLGVVGLIVLIVFLIFARFIKLWAQAYFADAGVRMVELFGMAMRKVDPQVIVMGKIRAIQAGLNASTRHRASVLVVGNEGDGDGRQRHALPLSRPPGRCHGSDCRPGWVQWR